ncbi:helix-turn-helix domain-containing protein [Paracidovorax wautersii]|uniref:helix-turn-helix domain-containing protein n=1 Tax=Paracidovorax wautersii TaxID=1177982 RepID=UPI0031D20D79
MQAWTTQSCAHDERFSYWREVLCQAFVSLDPVLPGRRAARDFVGEVGSRPLSLSAQTQVFSRAQFIQRRSEEIRRNPVEFCFANFQLEGSCVVRQDGQESLVSPGDFSIVDSTRPYFLDFRDDWRVLSFRIPREQVTSRLAAPYKATARRVDGSTGMGLVASRFARSLEQVDPGVGDAVQDGLSAALNSIIAMALGATLDAQERDRLPVRDAFRLAVETYIRDHLEEPSLGPDMLASRFKVSRRTLYGLFESEPLSVSGLIRELRLQRSARDLLCPAHPGVLAVALRWGFSDASHFSRLFKRRFGACPRAFAAGEHGGFDPAACGAGTAPALPLGARRATVAA